MAINLNRPQFSHFLDYSGACFEHRLVAIAHDCPRIRLYLMINFIHDPTHCRHDFYKVANPEGGEKSKPYLTENNVSDDQAVKEFLGQIEQTILDFAADGAYDKRQGK